MSDGSVRVVVHDTLGWVRERPGMYFGGTGATGLEQLAGELVANSVDQFAAGRATSIAVELRDGRIRVEDDGPGLPFDVPGVGGERTLAEHYLTTLHTTRSADAHAPHVHVMGPHGVGLAAVNAVARPLVVTSWRAGVRWEQTFVAGEPVEPPVAAGRADDGRGTCIDVTPDPEIWGSAAPRPAVIRARLFVLAHLFPGLRVGFGSETFCSARGLLDLAAIELTVPTPQRWQWDERAAFVFDDRLENVQVAVAAIGSGPATRWRTWVNGVETAYHGSHRAGIAAALRDIGWRPALVLAHVVMHDPRFAGPTRDRLDAPSVARLLRRGLAQPLAKYASTHLGEDRRIG